MAQVVILMGIKHCGKSTQGRLLAKYYACPLYDTDDVVKELTGKTPRELYVQDGESAFMRAEADACQSIITRISGRNGNSVCRAIIATGGGICNNQVALEILRAAGVFMFLCAEEKTAADRIVREVQQTEDGALKNLPAYIAKESPQTIADVRASFHRFYTERTARYAALADETVPMRAVPPEENMRDIVRRIESHR